MNRRGSRTCEECGIMDDLTEIGAGIYLCDDCSGWSEAMEAAHWDGEERNR